MDYVFYVCMFDARECHRTSNKYDTVDSNASRESEAANSFKRKQTLPRHPGLVVHRSHPPPLISETETYRPAKHLPPRRAPRPHQHHNTPRRYYSRRTATAPQPLPHWYRRFGKQHRPACSPRDTPRTSPYSPSWQTTMTKLRSKESSGRAPWRRCRASSARPISRLSRGQRTGGLRPSAGRSSGPRGISLEESPCDPRRCCCG